MAALAYNAGTETSSDDIFAYQSGNEIIVNGEGELQVFDVMGRLIATQRIDGVGTWRAASVQHGVYIFRLNEKVQKITPRARTTLSPAACWCSQHSVQDMRLYARENKPAIKSGFTLLFPYQPVPIVLIVQHLVSKADILQQKDYCPSHKWHIEPSHRFYLPQE